MDGLQAMASFVEVEAHVRRVNEVAGEFVRPLVIRAHELAYSAAAYITALAVNFFTTAFAFVTALDVIMQQPIDK